MAKVKKDNLFYLENILKRFDMKLIIYLEMNMIKMMK